MVSPCGVVGNVGRELAQPPKRGFQTFEHAVEGFDQFARLGWCGVRWPNSSLDVPRYLGIWYEVAKYPNRFLRKCASDTRAIYSQRDDVRIKVVNQCRREDGSLTEVVGVARQVGPPDSAQLKVRFAPAWLSFLPVVWGNYWVIDLDPECRLVAVSEPKREYL